MYVYQSLNGLPFAYRHVRISDIPTGIVDVSVAYRHVRISDIPTGIVDVSVNVCVTVQQ